MKGRSLIPRAACVLGALQFAYGTPQKAQAEHQTSQGSFLSAGQSDAAASTGRTGRMLPGCRAGESDIEPALGLSLLVQQLPSISLSLKGTISAWFSFSVR